MNHLKETFMKSPFAVRFILLTAIITIAKPGMEHNCCESWCNSMLQHFFSGELTILVMRFSGYTLTLESGFPDEAIKIVLESIRNSDKYVGEMRASIDGSSAP